MSSKGRVKYVPKSMLDALDIVKKNYNYNGENADADAFKKTAEFVPIGIEIDNAIRATGLLIRRRRR